MRIFIAQINRLSGQAELQEREVPEEATAEQALKEANIPFQSASLGLWCQLISPQTILHEGDRIDIGQELIIDRIEARRIRAQNTRSRRNAPMARHGGKMQLVKSF